MNRGQHVMRGQKDSGTVDLNSTCGDIVRILWRTCKNILEDHPSRRETCIFLLVPIAVKFPVCYS